MTGKLYFLIGHRDAPESIMPALRDAVERIIAEDGVVEFVVGHYGTFDRMAARVLAEVKQRHPSIVLTLLLPYHPTERPPQLPDGFDGTFYPPGMEQVPRRFAISRANRYMIGICDYLICYDKGYVGNTREMVAYARRLGHHIENVADYP